jgi:hypothetical protein
MADTNKTNTEGGQDFDGLQDFIVSVDTEGYEPQEKGVELDLGEQRKKESDESDEPEEKPKEDETKDTPKEGEEGEETKEAKEAKDSKEETPPEENQKDSYYGKLAAKFLEKGKWGDALITQEDGSEVKLSELDTIDEETFFAIEESQSKFNEEDIKSNYIKKGDFDENKLKLIEILKEGGDIKDIFDTPEEAQRPFEGVDVEDVNIQKNVFFNYLTKVQRLNPEDAKVVLSNHDKRGELEPKVKEIVEGYQSDYDKKLADRLEDIKSEKAERISKDKEFNKSLEEIYKNYNLDSKMAKKFSTLGTKRTNEGDYELDSIYAEKMEKPDEAAELIFFLNDKEGYLKSKMSDTKINSEKEHLRTINLLPNKQRKDDKAKSSSNDGKNDFVISVNE